MLINCCCVKGASDGPYGDMQDVCGFVLFQATINLVIGYEPPASTISNPNAQVDGDASATDAGQLL